jgi:hypothetical protein
MPTATKTATKSSTKTAQSAISDTPLAKKLLVKPGCKVGLVSAPEGTAGKFEPLPEGVSISEKVGKGMDVVIGFVRKEAELKKVVEAAQKALKPDGVLWLCYMKGGAKVGTDLNRDILWQAAKPYGLEGVTQIAFDDLWSAMRFKPRL